jgi:hypothetical protein
LWTSHAGVRRKPLVAHLVGGIAGEEDAAVAILPAMGRGDPRRNTQDLHRQVGTPAASDQPAERLGVKSSGA